LVAEPTSADAELDDAPDLVARAAAGDEVAFVTLYRDLQPRLLRYATSLVGADADDVTSEAWLQIVRDLPGFVGDLEGFRGWTARIVRNRAMDWLRSGARRPARPTPGGDLPELAATDDTAASALDHLSTQAAIRLIAALPREQSEAVLLRAVVGLDAKSAGEVLGKSPAAVRVSSHRGLRRLAKTLRSRETRGGLR
jgi:RNA polymerase sigma-70 factor (ECF subfamily)